MFVLLLRCRSARVRLCVPWSMVRACVSARKRPSDRSVRVHARFLTTCKQIYTARLPSPYNNSHYIRWKPAPGQPRTAHLSRLSSHLRPPLHPPPAPLSGRGASLNAPYCCCAGALSGFCSVRAASRLKPATCRSKRGRLPPARATFLLFHGGCAPAAQQQAARRTTTRGGGRRAAAAAPWRSAQRR